MKILQKRKQKNNTRNLKYESLLENHVRDLEKIQSLQNKTITLLEELRARDIELLDFREKEVDKLRAKFKKKAGK